MARRKKVSKYVELFDETIKNLEGKPKILIQACCAPCSSAVLELLADKFEIVLFFNGHNIYPYAEYEKRLNEVKRLVDIARADFNATIELIVINPQIEQYNDKLAFGADQKEGGTRCAACYGMRLKETLDFAVEKKIEYVTTVMTISRQKCSEKINKTAENLMPHYPQLNYVYSDFKKRHGNTRSTQLCKEYDLYQQQYCGCSYSLNEYYQRINDKIV
jgi:predicted adenine nucleotide alpha hydrolase (AANH) superfamily ATPase